jgi:hypothetical protein
VRIAVFINFAYFAIMYLFNKKKKYLPIQFLTIYLKIVTIVGCIIFYQADVENSEYFVLLFFGFISVSIDLSRGKEGRRYFSKKRKRSF